MAYQLNLTLFTLHSFCLSPNASRDRVPQNTSFPWRIGGDRRRFGYPAMRYESAITRRCHLPCRLVPGTQQETHLHVSPIHIQPYPFSSLFLFIIVYYFMMETNWQA